MGEESDSVTVMLFYVHYEAICQYTDSVKSSIAL